MIGDLMTYLQTSEFEPLEFLEPELVHSGGAPDVAVMEAAGDERPTVKSAFESLFGGAKIDKSVLDRLRRYQLSFVNRNADHIAFFGGNLTGVHVVRFTTQDRDRWFDEILDVDEISIQHAIDEVPGINPEFNVSSDVFNLSCLWLAHAIYNSPKLTTSQKSEGMVLTMLVLQYRFLTSRLFRHFPYPADKAIAQATYARLSKKFLIKTLGSWNAVLRYRSEDIVANDSIHFKVIKFFDNDAAIVNALNDIQGRIRNMLKNIYNEFKITAAQGIRISSSSAVIDYDGESILKDQVKSTAQYTNYILSVIPDRTSFIRQDLLGIITRLVYTADERKVKTSLEYLSDHLTRSSALEDLVKEVMVHAFDFMGSRGASIRGSHDLASLLEGLKGVYSSSRSTDKALLEIRQAAQEAIKKATGSKNENTINAVRTALVLYIVARALTMNHFSAAGVPKR